MSDEISYKQFVKEYINTETWDKNWDESENGEWVKIVDNNNDGKAEYAFKTQYWLDEAVHTRTKDGETILEYRSVDRDDDDVDEFRGEDDLSVGDVVLYTFIDGVVTFQKVTTPSMKV